MITSCCIISQSCRFFCSLQSLLTASSWHWWSSKMEGWKARPTKAFSARWKDLLCLSSCSSTNGQMARTALDTTSDRGSTFLERSKFNKKATTSSHNRHTVAHIHVNGSTYLKHIWRARCKYASMRTKLRHVRVRGRQTICQLQQQGQLRMGRGHKLNFSLILL